MCIDTTEQSAEWNQDTSQVSSKPGPNHSPSGEVEADMPDIAMCFTAAQTI